MTKVVVVYKVLLKHDFVFFIMSKLVHAVANYGIRYGHHMIGGGYGGGSSKLIFFFGAEWEWADPSHGGPSRLLLHTPLTSSYSTM